MRKYAYLKQPRIVDCDMTIHKVMLYQTKEGVYLFEYSGIDALQCSADLFYDSLEALYEEWNDLIDEKGWIDLEDPLPGCQHDAFIPLRVKGRDAGSPEWGRYETVKDGVWVDFEPNG